MGKQLLLITAILNTYIQIHCTIIPKADKENISHYLCLVLTHSELVLMAVHTLEWKWYL